MIITDIISIKYKGSKALKKLLTELQDNKFIKISQRRHIQWKLRLSFYRSSPLPGIKKNQHSRNRLLFHCRIKWQHSRVPWGTFGSKSNHNRRPWPFDNKSRIIWFCMSAFKNCRFRWFTRKGYNQENIIMHCVRF